MGQRSRASESLRLDGKLARLSIAATFLAAAAFCAVVLNAAEAQLPVDPAVEAHEHLLSMLERMVQKNTDYMHQNADFVGWMKIGAVGVITTLCTVIGILYNVTLNQQKALKRQQEQLVNELKGTERVKGEAMARFGEIHEENLINGQKNREQAEKVLESMERLTGAIHKLPCVDKKNRQDADGGCGVEA
jgi:hypothetical protein